MPGLAAEVAFYGVLALGPALLVLAAAIGTLDSVIGVDAAVRIEDNVIDALATVLASDGREDSVVGDLRALFRSGGNALTVGLVLTLWSSSRGMAAVIDALDAAYDVEERRSWVHRRALGLGLAAGTLLVGAIGLTALVAGPLLGAGDDIAAAFGVGSETFAAAWDLLRLPVAAVALVAWAATLYHLAPHHPIRTPWREDLPGAVVAAVAWGAASIGLRFYLQVAGDANAVVGALGGVLALALWFWLLALGLLVGAEVNAIRSATRRARAASGVDWPVPATGS